MIGMGSAGAASEHLGEVHHNTIGVIDVSPNSIELKVLYDCIRSILGISW